MAVDITFQLNKNGDGAGALTNIAYSDDTPDVAFQYDRMGRQVSAITAGVSTNLYGYSAILSAG